MDCLSVREAFFCSYTYGEIWDELLQYAADSGGSLSEAKINSLTPAAREKLLNLLDEILEED
jgi:hypothetical protein